MRVALLLTALLLAGCASSPPGDAPTTTTAATTQPTGATTTTTAPTTTTTATPPTQEQSRAPVSASGVTRPGDPQWTLPCEATGHQNWRTQQTLAVAPDGTLYVAAEFLGAFKSTDGGATWMAIPKGLQGYARKDDPSKPCHQEFGRIVIDPTDAKHLLLSRVDSPGTLLMPFSENAGLWESLDGGASWRQTLDDWMDASGSRAVAFAPSDPKVVYHGVNGMPASWGGAPPDVYVKEGVLYRSDDSGDTWRELPTGLSKGLRASDVLVDPSDEDHVLLALFAQDPATGGLAAEQRGLIESRDGGKTWSSHAERMPADARALIHAFASPSNFSHLVLVPQVSQAQFVLASLDGGATWQRSGTPAPEVVAFDPRDAEGLTLVGANRWEGMLRSVDGGVTWTKTHALPSDFVPSGDNHVTSLVFDPRDAGTLYVSGDEAKVWRSTDGGATWTTLLDVPRAKAARDAA